MKSTKTVLSILLVLVMCFTTLPVVSAENTGTTADGFQYSVNEGKITITSYTGEATEVAVPEEIDGMTVTAIGESAFYFKDKITKINLPDTITHIQNEAFRCCYALQNINLPKNLEVIGEEAFYGCPIEEIHIPNDKIAVELNADSTPFNDEWVWVRAGAFEHCTKLSTVTFAEGITKIPDNLFAGCVALEKVIIPETVKSIGKGAFTYCLGLKEVSIPEGVTEIGAEAFSNCQSLKEVTLPESLQKLGGASFEKTAIESIYIPASVDEVLKTTLSSSMQNIHISILGPFYKCENLKTASFDEETTEITPNIFTGTDALEEVFLPEGVTKIGENAFLGCSSLKSIDFPTTLTEIDTNAFAGATALKDVELPESIEKLGACAFQSTAIEEIVIPSSLKEADAKDNFYSIETEYGEADLVYGPFYRCESLKKASFDNEVTEVIPNLFAGAFSLEEIEFNGNIKTIGKYAFNGCTSLKEMAVPESLELVDNRAFQACIGLEKISFKSPDTLLNGYVFQECYALKDVALPENIKEIPYGGFFGCVSLESIEFPESVEHINGVAFCLCSSLDEISLPENLKLIENNCFAGCSSLKSITIPKNTHTIEFNAFKGCTSLENVEFTDYSVRYIESGAFNGCASLDEIALPKGLLEIEESAFKNCPSLLKAVVPYSVTTIEENVFDEKIVTIYSREDSYVHDYANLHNIKFVNDYIPATTIEFIGESPVFIENFTEYRAQFKLTPENSTEIITLDCDHKDTYIRGLTIEPVNLKDSATVTATLENGNSCSFVICSRLLESIEITSLPEKTEYIPGEALDATGLKVQSIYSNGDVEEITDYTLEGFSSAESGEVAVTVVHNKYSKEFTAEFTVRIKTKALIGDVNLDDKINIKDATAIQKHLAKLSTLDDNNLKVADVNADDKVNVRDATEIQKFIANILSPEETNVGKETYI